MHPCIAFGGWKFWIICDELVAFFRWRTSNLDMFGCYIYRCDHRSFAMGVADDLFCRLVSEYNVTLSTNCVFFCRARPKIKCHKCPCNYYSHASATYHLPIAWWFGSLTEPGPEPHSYLKEQCTEKCNHKRSIQGKDSLMGQLHARSFRNNTADFVDYVCKSKIEVFAITETWLCTKDEKC